MSVRTMAKVWEYSQHGGTELLALLALADFADDDGNSFPSVGTLARKCRLQPRRMNYILASLEESGEVEIRKNKGRLGTNLYKIRLLSQGVHSNAGVQSSAGVQSDAGRGCTPVREPLHSSAPKPSLTIKEPSKRQKLHSEHFDVFYAAYPRKVGKTQAIKAFKSAKVDEQLLQVILADIDRRMSGGEWTVEKVQFIPHPSTYLNNRRWEDEVTPSQQAPANSNPWDGAL